MEINHNSSPNFGMAMTIRSRAQGMLAKKITSEKDITLLDSLVKEQEKNPFNIDIRKKAGDSLEAFISDATDRQNSGLVVVEQSWVEKYITGPMSFIKRCCKIADSKNEEKYHPNLDSKLKDIFEKTKVE